LQCLEKRLEQSGGPESSYQDPPPLTVYLVPYIVFIVKQFYFAICEQSHI